MVGSEGESRLSLDPDLDILNAFYHHVLLSRKPVCKWTVKSKQKHGSDHVNTYARPLASLALTTVSHFELSHASHVLHTPLSCHGHGFILL
jgi:hypothetical protein